MPEAPDTRPRHLWALVCAALCKHRVAPGRCREIELAEPQALDRVYLDANWSFYRRCSPAEKEQEKVLAPPKRLRPSGFLRWALLMRAIK